MSDTKNVYPTRTNRGGTATPVKETKQRVIYGVLLCRDVVSFHSPEVSVKVSKPTLSTDGRAFVRGIQ